MAISPHQGPDSPNGGLTRRGALKRSGQAALAATALSLLEWVPGAAAADAGALTGAQQGTFAALVPSYAGLGGPALAGLNDDVVRAFQAIVSGLPPEGRAAIGTVLDLTDAEAGGLARLSVPERRKLLADWATAKEPDDARMLAYRPSDPPPGTTVDQTNLALSAQIQANVERIRAQPGGAKALALDPVTGLTPYDPPFDPQPAITSGGALDTKVRLRRHLQSTAYLLVVAPLGYEAGNAPPNPIYN